MTSKQKTLFFFFVLYLLAPLLFAHKGKKHAPTAAKDQDGIQGLKEAGVLYAKNVKPIFKEKCFNCHAIPDKLPWYAKVPGVKQLIQYDMREAKKHLDMRMDFPFGGHGTPLEDLKEIEEVIQDGSMPPWRYRIMHRGSALTQEEIQKIQNWIESSRKLIQP